MPETILSPSQIKLFGRLFSGLTLNKPPDKFVDPNKNPDPKTADMDLSKDPAPFNALSKTATSQPSFDQLTNQIIREDARLARIYSFTYAGEYTVLPEPSIFLVHGVGREIEPELHGALDRSGVAARDWIFERDIRYWEYDRINYSLRIDLASGTLDELLAQACGIFGDDDPGANPDLASRSHVSSRSHLSARSHLNARSHLTARHRIR